MKKIINLKDEKRINARQYKYARILFSIYDFNNNYVFDNILQCKRKNNPYIKNIKRKNKLNKKILTSYFNKIF